MNAKLTSVTASEAVLVCGGLDNAVRKIVYYIGYAIGLFVNWISKAITQRV